MRRALCDGDGIRSESDRNGSDFAWPLLTRPVPASLLSPSRLSLLASVGSGKTALTLALCRALRDRVPLGVVTNDIFTQEDAEFLSRHDALPARRIVPVETGGCPHAVRLDVALEFMTLEMTGDPTHCIDGRRSGRTSAPTSARWRG